MMTSNRPLEDWGKLIGDVPSATAILDRFLHHAEIIAITGRATACGTKPDGENKTNGSTEPQDPNTSHSARRL